MATNVNMMFQLLFFVYFVYVGLAGVNQKTVSKLTLKQYEESLSIERKHESERKKGFADQNKASEIISIFLKPSTCLEEKWLKKLDFVQAH